ncbi:MAG: dihydroxyacetone kinase subunit DhaL [Tepidisphaeraceae bacterium]|jgi:dihydroxyacetone kinase-like protein
MSANVAYEDFARMLREGAARLRDNHELLSKLDAATGDGDHGTTMKRVAEAILEGVQGSSPPTLGTLLETVGWSVMSVDGGSTSPLLGSFFMGMSEAAAGKEQANAADLAAIFEAGLAKLRTQTAAKPGDKTMVDALVPAVAALSAVGATVPQAMAKAAEAAAQGAESTKAMQAKFGRARNLGARTIGLVDPGATSISLMFAGFRDALNGL